MQKIFQILRLNRGSLFTGRPLFACVCPLLGSFLKTDENVLFGLKD